jgi:hypothetical protein
MALANPILLTSSGATFQLIELAKGISIPPALTITVGTAAVVGATTLAVTITAPAGVTLGSTTIYDGTYIRVGTGANRHIVVVNGDQLATVTSLVVEPIEKAIASGAVLTSFAGIRPLIGLEGANMQLQRQALEAVLLASKGWTSRSYSTANFQFSGTLYIPTSNVLADGANKVLDYLIKEKYVYVERFLANGDYRAGVCLVSDASDTVSQANFVQSNVTFSGTGVPVFEYVAAA